MKECKICYEKKDDNKFRSYKSNINGRIYSDSYCIDCRRLYDKEQHRIQRARRKDAISSL